MLEEIDCLHPESSSLVLFSSENCDNDGAQRAGRKQNTLGSLPM